MKPEQIDNEVCKYMMALESMESDGIITRDERMKLKTKVKAWAYDKLQRFDNLPKATGTTE
ncbi:hypothetical protein [Paenibacillus sp. HJGM_3]|uniref:hypothetical protein n=1 Tax=Paenibacillus sp. HJGM_3 TaxID=3379816 RepID=UPI00385B35D2